MPEGQAVQEDEISHLYVDGLSLEKNCFFFNLLLDDLFYRK
jgi:hypothetical protein